MPPVPATTFNHDCQTADYNYDGDYTDPIRELAKHARASVTIGQGILVIDFRSTTIHGGIVVNGVHVTGGLGMGVYVNGTEVMR